MSACSGSEDPQQIRLTQTVLAFPKPGVAVEAEHLTSPPSATPPLRYRESLWVDHD
jgi:hypothetical protein